MFYYYGRKRKIAKHYPPALHDATWLPFQPLVSLVGVAGKRFREGVWLNV